MSFTKTLKQDVKDAGVRVASKQISQTVKGSLVALMKKQKMSRSQLKHFSDFLETEAGTVFLDLVMGWGLTYAPMISADTRVQAVAEEFRVKAMSNAGNLLVESLAEKVLPVLTQNLGLLENAKARVDLGQEEQDDEPSELKAKAQAK